LTTAAVEGKLNTCGKNCLSPQVTTQFSLDV